MNNLKWINITLGIISMAILVTILQKLQAIFIPLTFAIILAFLFTPFENYLLKKRFPRILTAMILILVIFVSLTAVGTLVYTGLASFRNDFSEYEMKIVNTINDLSARFELPLESVKKYIEDEVDWQEVFDKVPVTRYITKTMGTFVDFVVKLILTIVLFMFIMAGKNRLGVRMEKILTLEEVEHSSHIIRKVKSQIIKYLFGKTIISLSTALTGMFFVYIFGIDFVIVSGLLLFVLNYIPNFGSIIASLFPITVCLFQYGFGWQLFAIIGAMILIQMIFGVIIEPKYFGSELNVSPVLILSALIFWAWVWGPVGMFLAVPLTATINIIFKEFKTFEVLSALISDD